MIAPATAIGNNVLFDTHHLPLLPHISDCPHPYLALLAGLGDLPSGLMQTSSLKSPGLWLPCLFETRVAFLAHLQSQMGMDAPRDTPEDVSDIIIHILIIR